VFKLEQLTRDDVRTVLSQAIDDPERGLGKLKLRVSDDALDHWADQAGGDARSALNALELAATTTPPDADGEIVIDRAIAAESIQRRVVQYDRDSDEHYDTISAFIKSLRGSDPDAALYWMAKMLYAGEDPRFIFRRMLILCSEDIGLADPNAIVVVNSLAEAFERVGMPEGNYFLSHACLYCATAPKSNTAGAIFKAISHIEEAGAKPVPLHLRDKTSSALRAQHEQTSSPTENYKYPHDYPGAWVEQQYLPEEMEPPEWYRPKEIGYERQIYEQYMNEHHEEAE
jgi:putative ATPase